MDKLHCLQYLEFASFYLVVLDEVASHLSVPCSSYDLQESDDKIAEQGDAKANVQPTANTTDGKERIEGDIAAILGRSVADLETI